MTEDMLMDLICADCLALEDSTKPAAVLLDGTSLCNDCVRRRSRLVGDLSLSAGLREVPEHELTDEAAKRRADEQAEWYASQQPGEQAPQ